MDELTPQQKIFVSEYIIDRNGRKSAIRAGYSEKTAEVKASQLLRLVKIKDAVDTQLRLREKRTLINGDYVLEGIRHLAENAEKDSDRLRAYELLGKNLKLFTDKTELSGVDGGLLALDIKIDYGE